jgi:hypothetical protein
MLCLKIDKALPKQVLYQAELHPEAHFINGMRAL